MKIGKKFNVLSKEDYFYYIDNHKKYTDFNTLGMYKSICENDKLEIADKIEVRDYANTIFGKTFNFYQVKDPRTYFDLIVLGKEMTIADERKVWDDMIVNQEKILSDKGIKHRNFGNYSKHNCGHEDCVYNGLMIRQGSVLTENCMSFDSDKDKHSTWQKAKRVKKMRKHKKHIIGREMDNEY